jgi:hypothetical protein
MATVQQKLRYLSFKPEVALTSTIKLQYEALKKGYPAEVRDLVEEGADSLTLTIGWDPCDNVDENVFGETFFALCGFGGWYLGESYPKDLYTALAGIFGTIEWMCYVWESTGGEESEYLVTVTAQSVKVVDAS